jgi:hypothetical protein
MKLPSGQARENFSDDLSRPRLDRRDDGMLAWSWLLKRLELALYQSLWHKVLMTRSDATGDECHVTFQVNQPHINASSSDDCAIAALEC